MPELPEVETMRRGLLPIVGRRIVEVSYPSCRFKPIRMTPRRVAFRRRCLDCTIDQVDRLGKRLIVRLESGDAITVEPRMTGLVLLSDPPDMAHRRIQWKLSGRPAPYLQYWDRRGLGSVRLLSPSQLHTELGPHRLGPDALLVRSHQLVECFQHTRRAVKVGLLDQRKVAGIGNLYASEILHAAGIHPAQPCSRIARSEWRRLHAAMGRILKQAIRYEGSTLSDGTYRNVMNQVGGYQNHHCVYGREGQPCRNCDRGRIRRIIQAQRSTFFCPHCQPAGSTR